MGILLERLCPEGPPSTDIGLTDFRPTILARQSRRFKAKVARQELANGGYCPAKKLYYHGAKIHVVGDRDDSRLFDPLGMDAEFGAPGRPEAPNLGATGAWAGTGNRSRPPNPPRSFPKR